MSFAYNVKQNQNASKRQVIFKQLYRQVFPLSPTLFNLYKKWLIDNKKEKDQNVIYNTSENQIERIMFDFQTSDPKRLRSKYRFFAFKTLTKLGLTLL